MKCLLRGFLEIAQKLEIYDMMALGYPAGQPKPRLVRERVEMVHHGRYGKAKYRSDDEEIRDFIVGLRRGWSPEANLSFHRWCIWQ
jgi:hypothetical protein